MEFSTKHLSPESCQTDCVVVGIHEARALGAAAQSLDRASKGAVREWLANGDAEGKTGSTRMLYGLPGVEAKRVLLVGLGDAKKLDARNWLTAVRSAVSAVSESGAKNAVFFLTEAPVQRRDAAWKVRQFAMAAAEVLYRFDQMKSTKPAPRPLAKITVGVPAKKDAPGAEKALKEGQAIAAGMSLTRDLGNLPGNVCTPSYLAEQAVRMARQWKIESQVLEQADMQKLGMGSLLSVTKGSRQPPKFVILRYFGAPRKEKPVVLVGKGITFDTGGISLKPGPEMDEMKFDMCGAASVIGTLRAVAEMKLRLNVIGLIPTCENMPDGAASKPGDIVTSMSGQTIEILNTDAEGRLILCDALTYAERYEPRAVVDVATLTGACIIALGHTCSGLFTESEAMARDLLRAGEDSWDRAWRLPLWEDYQEALKSNFADFANIGGRAAGSVTAACFLARFTKKYEWAHLDIAGTAWKSGKDKGASGRPVPLLTQYLMSLAGKR